MVATMTADMQADDARAADHAPLLSVVVPVHDEEEAIGPFLAEVVPVLRAIAAEEGVESELVFVDDGSRDETTARLLAARPGLALRLIRLSRNFGKEAAMTAGLAEARGDAVVIIDVDLQDPPELIAQMVRRWRAGARVVLARRADRSADSWRKRASAHAFYRLHNRISSTRIPEDVGDFRLMDRRVVEALNALPENRRFMKGLFAWVGFEPEIIDYERRKRAAGKSKFSGWRLWRFALEGITSFSAVPLTVWTYVGAAISLASFGYASFIVARTLIWGRDVPGYASMIVAILFLGGIQILGIGILGEYLGRVYSEVKRRPPYIVAERHALPAEPEEARDGGRGSSGG